MKTLTHYESEPRCLAFRESYDSEFINLFVGTKGGGVLSFRLADDLMVGGGEGYGMEEGTRRGNDGSMLDRRGSGVRMDMDSGAAQDSQKAKSSMVRKKSLHNTAMISDFQEMGGDVRGAIMAKINAGEAVRRNSVERTRRDTQSQVRLRKSSIATTASEVSGATSNNRRGSMNVNEAAEATLKEMRENL